MQHASIQVVTVGVGGMKLSWHIEVANVTTAMTTCVKSNALSVLVTFFVLMSDVLEGPTFFVYGMFKRSDNFEIVVTGLGAVLSCTQISFKF